MGFISMLFLLDMSDCLECSVREDSEAMQRKMLVRLPEKGVAARVGIGLIGLHVWDVQAVFWASSWALNLYKETHRWHQGRPLWGRESPVCPSRLISRIYLNALPPFGMLCFTFRLIALWSQMATATPDVMPLYKVGKSGKDPPVEAPPSPLPSGKEI